MSHSEKHLIRKRIASRVAQELKDGDIVNLGIGLPTLVANEVDKDLEILMQAENGLLGIDELADESNQDPDLVNAGAQPITAIEGACYFNSADSFAIIRGGHVDATVLGALQVDQQGNLANWIIPGTMEHTAKGKPKLLKHCTLPLTAMNQVNLIVTELGVFTITPQGIEIIEIAPDTDLDYVQSVTAAELIVSPNLKAMPC